MQNQTNAVLNEEVSNNKTKKNFPILVEKKSMQEIQIISSDFVETFAENNAKTNDNKTWLIPKLQQYLPEKSITDIEQISNEIETHLQLAEQNKQDFQNYINSGRSKESWFADQVMKSTANMSMENIQNHLFNLDSTLQQCNENLYKNIERNLNPHLDGLIAERFHSATFNLSSEARIGNFQTKVLNSNALNSPDIVMENKSTGKIVQTIQSKYYRSAEATERAFKQGDYANDVWIGPADQNIKTVNKTIKSPDGSESLPFNKHGKDSSIDWQKHLQEGQAKHLTWEHYRMRDLALGIAKKASIATLQGMFIGAGFELARKLWKGEQIKGSDVVKASLKSGADFGLKTAIAGSLKVAYEKNLLFMGKVFPKANNVAIIANIAFVIVENLKVIGQILDGNLSIREGISLMMQTTISTVGGLIGFGYGVAAASLLVSGGLIGGVVGFVAGTIGYMLGSEVGNAMANIVRPVTEVFVSTAATVLSTAGKVVGGICSAIGSAIKSVASRISSIARGICSCFGF